MSGNAFPDLSAGLADRYRIERELGQGGLAVVYLAEDLKHRRKVAIKIRKPELAASLGAERFLREIETTANLRHPHILPLYDSGNVDGALFYVMPFLEGESLRDRLTRERQLPIDDALRIARAVSDALSYAHARGCRSPGRQAREHPARARRDGARGTRVPGSVRTSRVRPDSRQHSVRGGDPCVRSGSRAVRATGRCAPMTHAHPRCPEILARRRA